MNITSQEKEKEKENESHITSSQFTATNTTHIHATPVTYYSRSLYAI